MTANVVPAVPVPPNLVANAPWADHIREVINAPLKRRFYKASKQQQRLALAASVWPGLIVVFGIFLARIAAGAVAADFIFPSLE